MKFKEECKNKSNKKYTKCLFKVKRAELLLSLFKDIKFDELNNKDLRNSIEHFDERIDDFDSKKIKGKYDCILYNAIMLYKNKDSSFNSICPIKLYDMSSEKYYIKEDEFDVSKFMRKQK